MKRKLKIVTLFLILINLVGCVSNNFAYKQIAKCPQYFQDNIGEVKAEPFSLSGLFFRGYVKFYEEGNPIHLFGWRSKEIVWHEAFHSFDIRSWYDRNDEWEQFYSDFIGNKNFTEYDVDVEKTARAFAAWMNGGENKAIENYVTGKYKRK